MRITSQNLKELVGMAGDLSVSGKVTRVFDRKTGTSEPKGDKKGGPWAFQSFIIADEFGELKVTLKNREETLEKNAVGRHVTISSRQTQNGILGVKVEASKDPQYPPQVTITGSANIVWEGAPESTPASDNHNPHGVTDPKDIPWDEQDKSHPKEQTAKSQPAPKAPEVDLVEVRFQTIVHSVMAWKKALPELNDANHPAFKEIWSAMILAAGRNADTLMISQMKR